MKPAFSEYSYGFALTHEFCVARFGSLAAAPVFPSLVEEGKSTVGFDVHLKQPGAPLFLQFKISQYMVRRTALHWHLFKKPHYRFWLHAATRSSQHKALLAQDKAPNVVLYAAPAIHKAKDLDQAFKNRAVVASSVFFRPQDIGPLPDNAEHCIAFLPGSGTGYFCSEPRQVEAAAHGRMVFEVLGSVFQDSRKVEPTPEYFDALADKLEGADDQISRRLRPEPSQNNPLHRARERAAYAARTMLGAELLWVASVAPAA